MQRKGSKSLSKRLKGEFGASDMDTIFIVVIAVVVMGVSYLVLDWVKGVKDSRRDANYENWNRKHEKTVEVQRKPNGYQVKY